MYVVIETSDKQCKVQYGDAIYTEKPATEQDATVEFRVVAFGGEESLKVGAPFVGGASVTGEVLEDGKQKKITVSTYRPKKSSERKIGHRQPYAKVQIETINA